MKNRLLTLTVWFTALQLSAQSPDNLRVDSSYQRIWQAAFIGFIYLHDATAFDYNNLDSIVQRRSYFFASDLPESAKHWEERFRYFHSYFPQQTVVVEERSYDLKNWDLNARTTINHNTDNEPNDILHESVNSHNILNPVSRYLFSYNSAGKVAVRLQENWDPQAMIWVNNRRLIRQYNNMDQEVFNQESEWDTDSLNWMVRLENSIQYDNQGRKTEQLESRRIVYEFRLRFKYNWTYNPLGLVDTFRDFTTSIPGLWQPRDQTTTLYDNQGNPEIQLHYSGNLSEWQLRSKRLWHFTPTTPGIPDSTTLFEWDESLQKFKIADRETFTFEELPGDRYYYKYRKEELYLNEWVENKLQEKWYSKPQTSALPPEQTPPNPTCLVPNPYLSGQTIQCTGLNSSQHYQARLFSMDGREVFATQFQGNQPWQMSCQLLPSGTYNLLILGENKAAVLKKIILLNP
ncbi:MAG: T9SS type A sorting domain-containing protein [Lewinellaceae bacterium]|nr:T9SS type A sorting domain-containing protein [Lewinellaceae bacterium]